MKEKKKKVDNRKIRFSSAPWANTPQHIVVGGVGGIGSWLAFFLSRIGHKLYIYDMDTVDQTNMGGQLYGEAHIGQLKTSATKDIIHMFSGADAVVNTYDRYKEEDGMVTPVMFSCFDNMAARKVMFEKWAAYDNRSMFIDGRMLAEVGNIFCVLPGQEDEYRKMLFDDSEVEEADCSLKATSHCGAFIGTQMTSVFNNQLSNLNTGFEDRVVNFQTDFELPLLSVEGYEYDFRPKPTAAVEVAAAEVLT